VSVLAHKTAHQKSQDAVKKMNSKKEHSVSQQLNFMGSNAAGKPATRTAALPSDHDKVKNS
jgi:hypothetical protein